MVRWSGTPEGIRTPDLLVRSQTLYPTELPARVHAAVKFLCNSTAVGGGRGRIRTIEVTDGRFTVCSLWPLGNSPVSKPSYYTTILEFVKRFCKIFYGRLCKKHRTFLRGVSICGCQLCRRWISRSTASRASPSVKPQPSCSSCSCALRISMARGMSPISSYKSAMQIYGSQ